MTGVTPEKESMLIVPAAPDKESMLNGPEPAEESMLIALAAARRLRAIDTALGMILPGGGGTRVWTMPQVKKSMLILAAALGQSMLILPPAQALDTPKDCATYGPHSDSCARGLANQYNPSKIEDQYRARRQQELNRGPDMGQDTEQDMEKTQRHLQPRQMDKR